MGVLRVLYGRAGMTDVGIPLAKSPTMITLDFNACPVSLDI
jgi:hypothetical protein